MKTAHLMLPLDDEDHATDAPSDDSDDWYLEEHPDVEAEFFSQGVPILLHTVFCRICDMYVCNTAMLFLTSFL